MVTVTDRAKTFLAKALDDARNNEEEQDICFRLVRSDENKLGIVVGKPTKSDTQFEQDESTILVMDEEVSTTLDGRTVDLVETEAGRVALSVK